MSIIFIAEIGMNHNGNFGLLHELIKQASLSGANIAKFQILIFFQLISLP